MISPFKFFIAILFYLSLSPFCSVAQSFEGKLTYKIDFAVLPKMEKMGVTKEIIAEKMKEEGRWHEQQEIYYSEDGFFFCQYDNDDHMWQIYRPDSNKHYTIIDTSDLCTVLDISVDLESKHTNKEPQIIQLDTTLMVFDRPCKAIRIKWKTGYYDYVYSEGFLKVNPANFKNYKYDGWSQYLERSGCLPLMIVKVVNGMMKNTLTLVEVEEINVDHALFQVPRLIPSEENLNLLNISIMKIDGSN